MSFDGIPRPSQVNAYTHVLNPYQAQNQARAENDKIPLVQSPHQKDKVKALQKEQHEHAQADEEAESDEFFDEEEAEQLRIFAKMRGIMNFSLENGVRYTFQVNTTTGLIDLVEEMTGNVVLKLMPEELMQLSQKIQRYAGILTDRTG